MYQLEGPNNSPGCLFFFSLAHCRAFCFLSKIFFSYVEGFPGGSDGGKECACRAGALGSMPGLGRLSGEGNGYPLQYSCLENSVDSHATVHGVAKSWT